MAKSLFCILALAICASAKTSYDRIRTPADFNSWQAYPGKYKSEKRDKYGIIFKKPDAYQYHH